ncbi:MAG TPA: ABC transporter permease, partial [Candidatus Limnocylindrales bacterium]|nr:ABC transporter permease [Candidatus Limnocylindrales bacterium]
TGAGLVDETGLFAQNVVPEDGLTVFADTEAATEALTHGDISVFYVVPADYMETGRATLVMPGMDISQISEGPVRALVLRTLTGEMDPQLAARLMNPALIEQTNVSLTNATPTTGDEAFGGAMFVVYLLTLVLMISLFVTNGYLMQSVIEEKETRLIEILLASVRPTHLLAGKILANGAMGLFQLLMWLLALVLGLRFVGGNQVDDAMSMFVAIAQIDIPAYTLALIVVYFLLAYLMYAGFYGMIGAISNSMREGPQYAALLTLPTVVPLMFITVILQDPNGTLAVALSIIPFTSVLGMPMRLVITTVPPQEIALSLALLALTGAGMIWAAGRVFGMQVLLAGQAPKLRDLPKLVMRG